MERLTERTRNGTAVYKHPTPEPEGWKINRHQVLERCCQYEDTGLTPEDIMELKAFYSNPLNTAVPAVSVLPEKPLEEKIKDAIKLLRANDYIVKKWTPAMEQDADECERMDAEGKSKDCFGCACSVCLAQ